MDNNQDKYTNYRYNGEGDTGNDYYSEPKSNYNPAYSQPQNNYNQPYTQPQNNYNQPYAQPQNNYYPPNYNQNPYSGQPAGYGYQSNANYTQPQKQHANVDGFCISSMACGIMSIPLGFCYGFGLILSIVALIMRGTYRKRHHQMDNGMSKAGLVTGIIGIVTSVLFWMLIVFIFMLAMMEETV